MNEIECKKNCECIDCTHFSNNSSLYGLKENHFYHLDELDKTLLKRMISRIMERAYRRGVQQSIHLYESQFIKDHILNDLYSYRYDNDLDKSPGLCGFNSRSLARLEMEEHLDQVGL